MHVILVTRAIFHKLTMVDIKDIGRLGDNFWCAGIEKLECITGDQHKIGSGQLCLSTIDDK